MRKISKVDINQPEVVQKLREGGATVAITSNIGNGFVDTVVGYKGFNFLFEIKDGSKPPSKRKLTEDEQKFFATWKGQKDIIYDARQAFAIMDETIDFYNRNR
jgi:hypothetical protein